MRGTIGIIVAVGLGVLGAVMNFIYLSQQAMKMEKVAFVAIDTSAQINLGDVFKESHFTKVDIPANNLGNLQSVAVEWKDLPTVIGMKATRAYRGGEILLQQDLKSPPVRSLSEQLGKDELARTVPVDPRSFVPELLVPGDLISFVVPKIANVADAKGNSETPLIASTSTTVIGPFQVISLGARMGSTDVMKANNQPSGQQDLLNVRVRRNPDGRLESQAELLFQYLASSNNSPLQVVVHPATLKNKPLP